MKPTPDRVKNSLELHREYYERRQREAEFRRVDKAEKTAPPKRQDSGEHPTHK